VLQEPIAEIQPCRNPPLPTLHAPTSPATKPVDSTRPSSRSPRLVVLLLAVLLLAVVVAVVILRLLLSIVAFAAVARIVAFAAVTRIVAFAAVARIVAFAAVTRIVAFAAVVTVARPRPRTITVLLAVVVVVVLATAAPAIAPAPALALALALAAAARTAAEINHVSWSAVSIHSDFITASGPAAATATLTVTRAVAVRIGELVLGLLDPNVALVERVLELLVVKLRDGVLLLNDKVSTLTRDRSGSYW
jgi:hypothetical protein